MTHSSSENGNGDNGITRKQLTVLSIVYDHETCLVQLDAHGAIISLVQMMLDEVQRQLEIQRRQAAAIELQKQLADAQRTAAILHGIRGKG